MQSRSVSYGFRLGVLEDCRSEVVVRDPAELFGGNCGPLLGRLDGRRLGVGQVLLVAFDFSVGIDPLSQQVSQLPVLLGAVLGKVDVYLGDAAGEVFSRDR